MLHEYGAGRRGECGETQTLEDIAVLRLGEHAHAVVAAVVGHAQQVRNQALHHAGAAQRLVDGKALNHVALQAAASQNLVAVDACDHGIRVDVVEPESVAVEKPLNALSRRLQREGDVLYFVLTVHIGRSSH